MIDQPFRGTKLLDGLLVRPMKNEGGNVLTSEESCSSLVRSGGDQPASACIHPRKECSIHFALRALDNRINKVRISCLCMTECRDRSDKCIGVQDLFEDRESAVRSAVGVTYWFQQKWDYIRGCFERLSSSLRDRLLFQIKSCCIVIYNCNADRIKLAFSL